MIIATSPIPTCSRSCFRTNSSRIAARASPSFRTPSAAATEAELGLSAYNAAVLTAESRPRAGFSACSPPPASPEPRIGRAASNWVISDCSVALYPAAVP
jgi:hypothetical protein